jgi:citrate synthase
MTDQRLSVSKLENEIVAETRLSMVDGEAGRLIIAGKSLDALAEESTYAETALRLARAARGRMEDPDPDDIETFDRRLGQARRDAFEHLGEQGTFSVLRLQDDPMDALKVAMSTLPVKDEHEATAALAMGVAAVAAAAWSRPDANLKALRPDPELSHPADYLRLVRGGEPTAQEVRALETYLMSVSDHGMNASTFTARVIASTESDLGSALVGAIGALKGPLHGGAPGPVLDMLDAIGSPDDAEEWIAERLAAGERIMGMGHRVYQVRDPRATAFESALSLLGQQPETQGRLELARAVEAEAERQLAEAYPDRSLQANVEFYTAVLLEAVGLPRDLFTPTFAVGRCAGWSAHVLEQGIHGRLIRPKATYVG